MGKGYLEVANDMGMWTVSIVIVAIVIFQSVLFMQKAFTAGKEMGLTDHQLNSGLRSGIITSLGPSFAVLIGLVALIALIGAPMAWMRLSVIGAVMFETLAANYGAEALGVKLGGPGYDLVGLASSMWVMCLGSVGWLVIAGLFTHKLDQIRNYVVGGREYLLPVVSIGAILGAFGYQVSKFIVVIGPESVAALISGISMVAFHLISKNCNANWLKEWSLGLAMVFGMFSAVLI